MGAVILDTNVIVIANGRSSQASCTCVRRCREQLNLILQGSHKVVLDYEQLILREYRRNLKEERQPQRGRGDLFLQWLKQHEWIKEKCSLVHLTSIAGSSTDFEEFPTDNALSGFDPDDKKFIALAIAHKQETGEAPTILLAIDRGWLRFMDTLENYGVSVDLICEDDMQRPRQGRKRT